MTHIELQELIRKKKALQDSASEMLEVLKLARYVFKKRGTQDTITEVVESVIAKAEGRA